MEFTEHDVLMLVYNFAAVLSGGYLVLNLDVTNRVTLLGMSLLAGIVWTIYFKFAIVSRFADHPALLRAFEENQE